MNDHSASTEAPPASHAEAVIEQAAQIAAAGMPLPAGLRAAADEADSVRLAWGLRRLAAEIDRGRPWDKVVASSRLPPHLAGLIRAAERTGQLGLVMSEWMENRRCARQHWRSIQAALAYPLLTLVLTAGVFVLFAIYVVRPFEEIVKDFELRLPFNASALFYLSRIGPELFLIVAGLSIVGLVVLRLFAGRAGWSWLISSLPLIGPAWHWTGVAEMLRGLGLLVDHRVPLPEALRLTAGGITDGHVGNVCERLAGRVEAGSPLWGAIVESRSLPLSIVPLIHWGEEHDALAEALRAAAEMLEGRLRVRSGLLAQVLPPFIFVIVGVLIGSLIALFLTTMINLIQGLS
jgi:type II secretory pathway component PulF